jgi:negative regulator of flagellin synthesis FlgM
VKIDSNSSTQVAALKETAQRTTPSDVQSQPSAQAPAAAGNSTAEVSLSALSAGLHASSASDVDTAKVASIKAALADGSYKIDSGKIADGMLSDAKDLMQSKTPPAGD